MLVNKTVLLVGHIARVREGATAVSTHPNILNKIQPTRTIPR
ncbi:hypothetical protein [Candidatus Leptofilum sp.]